MRVGTKQAVVAQTLSIAQSMVSSCGRSADSRILNGPRSGRPKMISGRQDRRLVNLALRNHTRNQKSSTQLWFVCTMPLHSVDESPTSGSTI